MDTKDFVIEQVNEYSSEVAESVRNLAQQEGKNYKELTDADAEEMINNPHGFLFIARYVPTKKIVGMIFVHVYRIPYARKAYMDDLVVDSEFRGKGIGTMLMKKGADFAKEKGAAYADFTARPRREESNSLYEKLGFKKRDTNVYRLIFDYGEV